MKPPLILIALLGSLQLSLGESETEEKKLTEEQIAAALEKHRDGSLVLAEDQDKLSAYVQDLIDEQTADKVIKLLKSAEVLMAEGIDQLELHETGGKTIAIETEIIEKIYEAAKAKQQQQKEDGSPSSESAQAMMDMLQRMMGKKPGKPSPGGEQKEGKEGSKEGGGNGLTGDSDAANQENNGDASGDTTQRRVPKASGKTGSQLPREFQKALDAYNRNTP